MENRNDRNAQSNISGAWIMAGRASFSVLAVSCLAAFGLGYVIAPTEQLDTEVTDSGLFSKTTTQVLSVTVESLRKENKLQVFSYKGTAKVSTGTDGPLFFNGAQELNVPAVVNYYLDLNDLTLADVTFDEKAKLVRVMLPKLQIGDIAFQPEKATTVNGGLLTFGDGYVEAFRKQNYASARKAMVAQAQGKDVVAEAKEQAQDAVTSYFEIPLRIAGQPDVKVVATFK